MFRSWCFVVGVSFLVFRLSSFLFALCYLIFSSFFSPISTYYINYVFAEGGKGTGDGSVAAARIGTTARGGTFGGAHTQRQGRRPRRAVHAGRQGERFMRGVKASDHAAGSSVIMALRTKKNHRLDAERSALKSSPRLLVEIALCSEQNARRRSRGHTVGQTLQARVQRATQSHSGAKRSSLH